MCYVNSAISSLYTDFPMQKTCANGWCKKPFEVTEEDEKFLKKVAPVFGGKAQALPHPTQCPTCRHQRRLAIRNERNLYRATCALTKQPIISTFAPGSPFISYSVDAWWSDNWDALSYGKNFDFSKPFFAQFQELQKVVPRLAFLQYKNEGSEYTNLVSNLQRCYMLFSSDYDRDCHFGIWIESSRDCTDNLLLNNCELCNDCVFTHDSYACTKCVYTMNCRDCSFCFDCRGCESCLLCTGLRQKKYCIANVQYTKEEYEKKLKEFPLQSRKNFELVNTQFRDFMLKARHPYMWTAGTVLNCDGDIFIGSNECHECFEMLNSRDCRYAHGGFELKDAFDCCYVGQSELCYEVCEAVPVPQHSAFTMNSYTGANLLYCDLCMNNCQDCFGCIGLKKKQYCIFNKQYTKEEYEALVPKIIEHMRGTKEWGEFFPLSQSLYGYNESVAQDFFPMEESDIKARAWPWHTEGEENRAEEKKSPPDNIREATDSVVGDQFACTQCGNAFKIIQQELRFYKARDLPLPSRCFTCRNALRMKLRNPVSLWERTCSDCGKKLRSVYAPNRPERVCCEECYLKTAY